MPFSKVTYVNGETVIYADNLNDIQDELIRLEDEKQDALTIDTTVIPNSTNPVSGGAVYTAIDETWTDVDERLLDFEAQATLTGSNTSTVFRAWAPKARETTADNWALLQRWAKILRLWCADTTFTLRWYDPSVSGSSEMTPMDDLAQYSAAQLCTDSTTPVADWADEHPMGGWYIRANARIGATGEPVISAIEGLDAAFDETGDLAPVQVFSLALWKREWGDGQYCYKSWRAAQAANYVPYPGDVATDNTMRELTWHPAYPGGLDSAGHLTSGSGLAPYLYASATAGITAARAGGQYEGLWSDCDTIWLLDMWQLRHWTLSNSGYAEGCTNYSLTQTVALAEENVKRVLLTPANAADFVVGSTVNVGTGTSRDAASYSIAKTVRVSSIETVTVGGVEYGALNLDLDTNITTAADTTVSTMPWHSGATDSLPGHKDGSPNHLTNGKNPIRVMGVEAMDGAYALGLDPLWSVAWNAETSEGTYEAYEQRDSTALAESVSGYTDTGVSAVIHNGWNYIKAFVRTTKGILLPSVFGGSSSTYYRAAFLGASAAGVRTPWRFGTLNRVGDAGLACAHGYAAPGAATWTCRPRLSGAGAKRGEWTTTAR